MCFFFFYGLIVLFFLKSLILVLFKTDLQSDVEIVEVVNLISLLVTGKKNALLTNCSLTSFSLLFFLIKH